MRDRLADERYERPGYSIREIGLLMRDMSATVCNN